MPRPSLKEQRRKEILDAYVACVANYGLEGATQERIAAEAGVARPLLRHNLGNQGAMKAALVAHVADAFDALTVALGDAADDLDMLIDIVFDAKNRTDPQLALAFQALITASAVHPETRQPLLDCLERYVALITTYIKFTFPSCSKKDSNAIAHGIASISMSCDALEPLRPPPSWRAAAKRSAIQLVSTAGEKQ